MSSPIRVSNSFQIGLLGGLGVLTALIVGGAITTLANILTYVAAAIFIALGLEPVVAKLQSWGLKRRLAILTVALSFIGLLAALSAAIVPTLASQTAHFIETAPAVLNGVSQVPLVADLDKRFNGVISNALNQVGTYLGDSANWPTMFGGVVQVGLSIFNGAFGAIIIIILSLYFMASMSSFKRWIYSLVAASRRDKFSDLAEQISDSIGRYVMGQVSIGAIGSTLAFIMMSIVGVPYALVLAMIAFVFGLIPLVGSISSAILITLVALSVSPTAAIIAGVYFLVYMQVEAYLISPRIMSHAVNVPGAVVVVAALAGGALLGVLGALVAIPVAASILLILREVYKPYQDAR
jgi:predicted PurR-regulated permease PerM